MAVPEGEIAKANEQMPKAIRFYRRPKGAEEVALDLFRRITTKYTKIDENYGKNRIGVSEPGPRMCDAAPSSSRVFCVFVVLFSIGGLAFGTFGPFTGLRRLR